MTLKRCGFKARNKYYLLFLFPLSGFLSFFLFLSLRQLLHIDCILILTSSAVSGFEEFAYSFSLLSPLSASERFRGKERERRTHRKRSKQVQYLHIKIELLFPD